MQVKIFLKIKQGLVVHTYNLSTQEKQRQEDLEFETSLSCKERPYLKNKNKNLIQS
jgi:hypothetical protein